MVFLPSFWLLVPGSLGLIGTTQLAADTGDGFATALGAIAVIVAIALGVLVGSSRRARDPELRLRRRRPITTVMITPAASAATYGMAAAAQRFDASAQNVATRLRRPDG